MYVHMGKSICWADETFIFKQTDITVCKNRLMVKRNQLHSVSKNWLHLQKADCL